MGASSIDEDIPPWTMADTFGIIALVIAPFATMPLFYAGAVPLIPIVGSIVAPTSTVASALPALAVMATSSQTGLLSCVALLVASIGGVFMRRCWGPT
ncbi:hypothetical protein Hypma_007533 [Hypsizygus marmoreus]|uniref:Uncharacterized protein n=1 Tax=Hypsizygus marmoreus TaxID=39966 RepID=A0A369K0T1_HYPMA|nr:hypothetical protein Hypma_007533 [Hypsizygus marmoreus]